MSKPTTLDQRLNLLVTLATNTDWESLDRDLLQHLIDRASETGAKFSEFLRNAAQMSVAKKTPVPIRAISTGLATLTIDYKLPLESMILAGHYSWTCAEISEQFSVKGKGTVEHQAMLFNFNRSISSEMAVEVIQTADAINPWELGRIEHLLAFGAKHPNEQRKYPIVALGSVGEVDGCRVVPCLGNSAIERALNLNAWHIHWSSHYRFLAVRKGFCPSVS